MQGRRKYFQKQMIFKNYFLKIIFFNF